MNTVADVGMSTDWRLESNDAKSKLGFDVWKQQKSKLVDGVTNGECGMLLVGAAKE